MMTALLLYGYCNSVYSADKKKRRAEEIRAAKAELEAEAKALAEAKAKAR